MKSKTDMAALYYEQEKSVHIQFDSGAEPTEERFRPALDPEIKAVVKGHEVCGYTLHFERPYTYFNKPDHKDKTSCPEGPYAKIVFVPGCGSAMFEKKKQELIESLGPEGWAYRKYELAYQMIEKETPCRQTFNMHRGVARLHTVKTHVANSEEEDAPVVSYEEFDDVDYEMYEKYSIKIRI